MPAFGVFLTHESTAKNLVLCQVYFCDSKASDRSVEGVVFPLNRCPFVGAARSRTLSMGPESRGSTRDAQLRAAPTGFRPGLHLQQSWLTKY